MFFVQLGLDTPISISFAFLYRIHVDVFVLRVPEIYHILVATNFSNSCVTELLVLLDLAYKY